MSALAHGDRALPRPRATRIAAGLGLTGASLGALAGLAELTAGPSIRSWVGDKQDTTRLGLATLALSAIALLAASMLARRHPSVPGRLLIAAGLLVPALVCFTTVGRLWYLPGTLLLAAGLLVVADAWGDRGEVVAELGRRWTAILTVVLAAFYVVLGATALGVAGLVGIAGGVLVMVLVAAPGRLPAPAAVALLLIAAVPFAALTWWSVATPVIGLLMVAIGMPAVRSRRRDGRAPGRRGCPSD